MFLTISSYTYPQALTITRRKKNGLKWGIYLICVFFFFRCKYSGSLFWSDWGNPAKIETSKMDGSSRVVLVNKTIGWPNGLALDSVDRKLYWVDGKRNVLELIDLDSNRSFTLVSNNRGLIQPYGLTLDKTFVYWTEWNTSSIFRANKISGYNVKQILTGLRKPMDIQAFDKSSAIPGRVLFFFSRPLVLFRHVISSLLF